MALPIDKLGTITDPVVSLIDPDRAKAYAAATNDDNPAYTSGKYAPPVFAVVPTWDAMLQSAMGVVPAEAAMMIVHGEQDMHFHQPLVPGRSISTVAQPYSVRVGGTGTRCTIKVEATDAADGAPVLTEYVTMFIRGMSDGEDGGPDKPGHTLPESVRTAGPLTTASIHVDDDQTFRYRDASGDQMPIHVDDEFAKSVGLPGMIAHGLCTMAMTSQAIISSVADGDPVRLRRLAVRFSKNVFPGNDVITTIYNTGLSDGPSTGRRLYPFEADSAGQLVIANGLAEIVA